MIYRIFFDGSCSPNPGGVCRWSFVVDQQKRESSYLAKTRWEFFGSMTGEITDPPRTNNQAELTACLKAIRYLDGVIDAPSKVFVYGDSKLSIRWASGVPVKDRKHVHLIALQKEFLEAKRALACPIEFRWIPREENNRADSIMRQP